MDGLDGLHQTAFQQLRPPCVELSSLALKFRGKQTTVKSVLHALDRVQRVLGQLAAAHALDAKLAEYAFFPLTHIFNESQRLSSRCLELAVQCLDILVGHGWRHQLAPEMAKQLLILLSLLAGGSPSNAEREPPSDELKVAAFTCMLSIFTQVGNSRQAPAILQDASSKGIVDQSTFILLDAISESASEHVQLAAASALLQLTQQISSRLILASLLPRTVSALTKALRPSTQARRTYKVIQTDLTLLTTILRCVLSDDITMKDEQADVSSRDSLPLQTQQPSAESVVLDQRWLNETSTKVGQALTHVVKLRDHDRHEVREALLQLCLMVIDECPKTLPDSIPLMVETIVVLAHNAQTPSTLTALTGLASVNPAITDLLKTILHTWVTALPRLMMASDDRPRQRVLGQVSTTVEVLSGLGEMSALNKSLLADTLIDSVSSALRAAKVKSQPVIAVQQILPSELWSVGKPSTSSSFGPIVLGQQSRQGSLRELQGMLSKLRATSLVSGITRQIVDTIPGADGEDRIAAAWLALSLLRHNAGPSDLLDDFVFIRDPSEDSVDSQPLMISDLYSFMMPSLLQDDELVDEGSSHWELRALALECVVLQAQQLGVSYRPELIESLYPIIALFGSRNEQLQNHATVALNLLAAACEYPSATDMLIANVDYIINSIAIKLNTFDLSPEGPQVMLMMVRLCGARLVPYLDDLVASIFTSLDNFHGYPQLVEVLFELLRTIVDESAKNPIVSIMDEKPEPSHVKAPQHASTVGDILADLREADTRKRKHIEDIDEEFTSAPKRPWSSSKDGPGVTALEGDPDREVLGEEDNEELPVSSETAKKEKSLSKSHQLLLSIAEAATPHLSSPSAKVRLTLLQLWDQIVPLLAHDENTFLPLINAVWPALIAKLFADIGADGDGEAAFNVCAAAQTVSKLCIGAGDFMASRIDDIFPHLQKVYIQLSNKLDSRRKRNAGTTVYTHGTNIKGTVDLRITKSDTVNSGTITFPTPHSVSGRTTESQISNAFTDLFIAILNNVRITEDNGDAILEMLAPIMDEPGQSHVVEVLEKWNADAVWLVRERRRIEREMKTETRRKDDWTWTRLTRSSHNFCKVIF